VGGTVNFKLVVDVSSPNLKLFEVGGKAPPHIDAGTIVFDET